MTQPATAVSSPSSNPGTFTPTIGNGGINNKERFQKAAEVFSHLIRGRVAFPQQIDANELRRAVFTTHRDEIETMTAQPFTVRIEGVDYRLRSLFASRHSGHHEEFVMVSLMDMATREICSCDVRLRDFYRIEIKKPPAA